MRLDEPHVRLIAGPRVRSQAVLATAREPQRASPTYLMARGNSMWSNRTIPDDPVVKSNTRGYVTFAQSSALSSRTTHLFVNLGNNARLDTMRFAPFAVVILGMDVVHSLNAEYAEGPDQTQINAQGNAYLNADFPRLDYIVSAQLR